jgi:hypothetical protein
MPLIPFFERVYTFPFYWEELMTEDEAKAKGLSAIVSFDPNMDEKGEAVNKASTTKMVIVQRYKADQHYFLDNEIHPFYLDVLTTDCHEVRLFFNFSIKIEDMALILRNHPKGNFLLTAGLKIRDELRSRLNTKSSNFLRGLTRKTILPFINEVIATLNPSFIEDGFSLNDIIEEYFFPYPLAQDIFDAQMVQGKQEVLNETNVMVAENAAETLLINKKAEAAGVTVTGNAQNAVLKNREIEVGGAEVINFTKKLVALKNNPDKTKVEVAKHLSKVKGTLVIGGGVFDDSDPLVEQIKANMILKKGGANGNAA